MVKNLSFLGPTAFLVVSRQTINPIENLYLFLPEV